MRNLKINFQRFGSLALALIVAVAGVFCCAAPAHATSVDDIPDVYSDTVSFVFEVQFNAFRDIYNSENTRVDFPLYVAYGDDHIRVDRRIYHIVVTSTDIYYIYKSSLDSLDDTDWVRAGYFDDAFGVYVPVAGYELLYVEFPVSLLQIMGSLMKSLVALRGRYCFNKDLIYAYPQNWSFGNDFISNDVFYDGLNFNHSRSALRYNPFDGPFFDVYVDGVWSDDAYRFIDFGPDFVRVFDFGPDGALPLSYEYSVNLLLNITDAPLPVSSSFLDRVTSGLTAVIGWVGMVVAAITAGSLSALLPLAAVGIAVSAVLLIAWLIRKFIWGA